MSENAELWSRLDEESKRLTLESWFKFHSISYNKNLTTEELRQKYINAECGNFIKI